ncbi:MAG: diguanylate cyclase [Burkholderiaceae bacterium]|nr:diguanylate cyclase [Burkholderiaceae bacterium]
MEHANLRALRPLLRGVQLAAVLLAGLDLLLLALRLAGLLQPEQALGARLFSAAVSVLLLAAVLITTRRLERSLARSETASRQQQQVFDALGAGIVLFDAQHRIVLCNENFRRTYARLGAAAQPGATYEELLRALVAAGMAPEAAGHEQDWIAQRLQAFGRGGPGLMRQLPDGSWRRIVEQRLADGSVLAHIVDVSELVAKEQALDAARRDAERARARLAGAIEALPATFELYDADDRLVMWNRELARAYPHMAPHLGKGLRFEELARLNLAGGGQPDFAARPDDWVALRQGERREGRAPSHLVNDGHGRWLRVYETRLADGSMVAIRVDVTDVETQRRALDEARAELLRSRQRLEDAIEAMPAGFELYDADDRLVMVNRMNLQMYPQLADLATSRPTFDEVVRANAERGGLPLVQSPEALDAHLARRHAERRAPGDVRVHRIAEDRWVRVHERRTREGGMVAVRLDVSELMRRDSELTALNAQLARLNSELSVLSQTDALTGLANRRAFDLRLAEEVSRAVRHGMPLALLLVDVDHFKRYNDRYGHPAGDECLRRVAAVLREHGRRPTDLVARIGGEEFALLMPHEDVAGAFASAQSCVRAVDDAGIPHDASPLTGFVTISVGVAALRDGVSGAAALLGAADAALYAAKERGRHRAVLAADAESPH